MDDEDGDGVAVALPADDTRREIGDEAVWTLSSAKPGNGVDQLRDNSVDTYWQSDGSQPHLINMQFFKKMTVSEVAIYLDHKLDESYTPRKLSIRAGSTVHDLKEILTQEILQPNGWVTIPLPSPDNPESYVRAFFIQIAIVAMHQNGRDTHIRQIRLYTPRDSNALDRSIPEASTEQFWAYSCIR